MDELTRVTQIALSAGAEIRKIYAQEFAVDYKGIGDPVTEADRIANRLIVESLKASFPGDGIVAEENEVNDDALRGGRVWFVDPLDGTKEFVARNGEFAVMIGLAIDGKAQLGVVYQPASDVLFIGDRRIAGSARRTHAGVTTQLATSSAQANLRLLVSRSHRPKAADELAKVLSIGSETPCGSVGVKVGRIANNEADLYIHLSSRSSHWDACAPDAILQAAGGRFTRTDGKPYVYGGTDLRTTHGIVACNANIHERVIEVVRDIPISG